MVWIAGRRWLPRSAPGCGLPGCKTVPTRYQDFPRESCRALKGDGVSQSVLLGTFTAPVLGEVATAGRGRLAWLLTMTWQLGGATGLGQRRTSSSTAAAAQQRKTGQTVHHLIGPTAAASPTMSSLESA